MDVDVFLKHYGVKGMRWGVINEDKPAGRDSSTSVETKNRIDRRKLAIAAGSVAGVAALATGAYYLNKRYNIKTPIPKTPNKAFEQPTDIIFSSRGKNHGYTFVRKGGLKDPPFEYDQAGFNSGLVGLNQIRRYGDRMEKVAGSFADPLNRKDFANRPIFHEVILNEAKALGVDTIEKFKEVAWDEIKDEYDELYNRASQR